MLTNTMSGLLGFRSSRRASAPPRTTVTQEEDGENGLSIVSIVSDRSLLRSLDQKPRESRNSANGKHKKQQLDAAHSARSVMSDCSFNTVPATLLEDASNDDDDIEDSIVDSPSTNHAFLVECSNGEQIYVPSWQGRIIKARCRHFRVALGGRSGSCTLVVEGGGGGSGNSNRSIDSINEDDVLTNEPNQETFVMDNRVVPKRHWSPRTARHILEILTDGTTWIDHESSSSKHHHRRFVELLKACDELAVRLCLGSVINHHDVLDPASSLRFFQLSGNATLHRFKLSGTIQSWQWMQLLRSGVLLHLNSTKVLMLSSQESEGASERGRTQQRLSKCDDLYSEFSVYSEKSKMNTLYTIFDLLSTTATSVSNQNAKKGDKTQNRSGTMGGSTSRSLDESFRIIFRTEKGGLHEEDMNNLWRMTSASYTMSTPDESGFLLQLHKKRCNELQLQSHLQSESHLQSAPVSSNSRPIRRSISNNRALANFPPPPNIAEDDEDDHDEDEENKVTTTGNVSDDEEDSVGASSASYTTSDSYLDNETLDEPPTRTIHGLRDTRPSAAGVDVHPSTPSSVTDAGDHHLLPPNSYNPCRQKPTYETRTITGTSPVVLRHLFNPINSILHRHRSEFKGGHNNNITNQFRGPSDPDPSRLPACLSISNPTPDTLGRFLNACTSILGSGGNDSGGRSEGAGAGAGAATAAVTPTIGYHFVPSSSFSFSPSNTVQVKRDAAGTVFFVSGTSRRMKEVLAHMADYSQTSVVGDADFQLEQFRRRRE